MAGQGKGVSVDAQVVKTAKTLEHDGNEALHAKPTDLQSATNTLQSDWEEAQKHGPGFLREVARQMQSDTSSIGSMNIKVDLKNNCIEFGPSAFDFSEQRSSVKATALKNPGKGLFDGTGFAVQDANDITFYLGARREQHGPFYNPMRPAGIAELNPGEDTTGFMAGHGGKIESRKTSAMKNADGSTTYSYDGQVGGDLYKGMANLRKSWAQGPAENDIATGFTATETIGADGKTLLGTHIRYEKPKNLTFNAQNGVNNRGMEFDAVTEITGMRRPDGQYQARIDNANGTRMYSLMAAEGHVIQSQMFQASKPNQTPDWWVKSRD